MSLGWDLSPTAFPGGVELLGWDPSEALGRRSRKKGGTQVKEGASISHVEMLCEVVQVVHCTKVRG